MLFGAVIASTRSAGASEPPKCTNAHRGWLRWQVRRFGDGIPSTVLRGRSRLSVEVAANGLPNAVVQRSSPPREAYADESVGPDIHSSAGVGIDAGCRARAADPVPRLLEPVQLPVLRSLIRSRDRARGAAGRSPCASGVASDREPDPRRGTVIRLCRESRCESVGPTRADDPPRAIPRG